MECGSFVKRCLLLSVAGKYSYRKKETYFTDVTALPADRQLQLTNAGTVGTFN
jgi:hypothetical protein